MPGAVATATTANTSTTPPIPSRVGQKCRILDAAVTLLVLVFVTSWNPRSYCRHILRPRRAMVVRQKSASPSPSAQRLRLSEQSQQSPPTVLRDRQLQRIPHLSIGQLIRPTSLIRNRSSLAFSEESHLKGPLAPARNDGFLHRLRSEKRS